MSLEHIYDAEERRKWLDNNDVPTMRQRIADLERQIEDETAKYRCCQRCGYVWNEACVDEGEAGSMSEQHCCETCGQPVIVVSNKEGTCHYEAAGH